MEKRVTKSSDETKLLGKKLGERLKTGAILALFGDLGSGKTTFVQGIAQGVGITQRIVSPTFLILKTYTFQDTKSKPQNFYHADLYRIASEKDIESVGLQEIIRLGDSILVIEWPEKLENQLPKHVQKIRFSYISENEREILYE